MSEEKRDSFQNYEERKDILDKYSHKTFSKKKADKMFSTASTSPYFPPTPTPEGRAGPELKKYEAKVKDEEEEIKTDKHEDVNLKIAIKKLPIQPPFISEDYKLYSEKDYKTISDLQKKKVKLAADSSILNSVEHIETKAKQEGLSRAHREANFKKTKLKQQKAKEKSNKEKNAKFAATDTSKSKRLSSESRVKNMDSQLTNEVREAIKFKKQIFSDAKTVASDEQIDDKLKSEITHYKKSIGPGFIAPQFSALSENDHKLRINLDRAKKRLNTDEGLFQNVETIKDEHKTEEQSRSFREASYKANKLKEDRNYDSEISDFQTKRGSNSLGTASRSRTNIFGTSASLTAEE